MMKHLTRPPDPYTKEEKKKIVKDFHKKAEQPKSKPMGIVPYIQTMNRLYGSEGGAVEAPERYNDKILKRDKYEPREIKEIKKSLPVSELAKKFKKNIVKDTLIVEKKPKYLNGNVIDITPLIDDEWWKIFEDLEEPPKEESRLLLVPKSKAEGITSILNLHNKKFVG